jgi:6-phosphogluconolactonase
MAGAAFRSTREMDSRNRFPGAGIWPTDETMRMKLKKSSQLMLVSVASLLTASLVTACSQFTQTLTVDFVYVASSKAFGSNQYGLIDVFEINSESGRMRQIPTSPFPSGGRDPVAEAVSANYDSLFVANEDDNNIVQFVIGSDGKLYSYNTVNTPGIYPLALAANKSNLFVVDTFEPLPTCSNADPCSGSIAVYPLSAGTQSAPTAIGPPASNSAVSGNYWPLTLSGSNSSDIIIPTAVNVLASGAYVYVTAYDSSVTPSVGYIFGFSVGPGGVLTPLSGSPFAAGRQPSAIASDASNSYVYATDYANGEVLGYAVNSGNLVPMTTGTGGTNEFPAGNQPSAIVVNPNYPFVYVANSLDSTVTAYSVSNGALTRIGSYATGTAPVAIGIDPSTSHFLYTANFLGNNVSGFELSTSKGTLLQSQFSPSGANDQPTAVAAIPHNGTGGGLSSTGTQ